MLLKTHQNDLFEYVIYILCVHVLSHVRLFASPWTIAYPATLSMEFSRQEYWSGLPFPAPGNLPDPGIKFASHVSCIGRQILYQLCHLLMAIGSHQIFYFTDIYIYLEFIILLRSCGSKRNSVILASAWIPSVKEVQWILGIFMKCIFCCLGTSIWTRD